MDHVFRRTFLLALAAGCVASRVRAAEPLLTTRTQKSIRDGLRWLAAQQHENGAFGSVARYRENVGVAALAGLAFLSAGSTPGRGPYGQTLTRLVDYLLSCATPTGYIIEQQSEAESPMYGHGFATTFLAEVLGMVEREELAVVVRKAVALIVQTQNSEGGWRYYPVPKEADLSVTVCQLMALRAARNTGISVPKATIDQGISYIERCQNPDGGFRYRIFDSLESRFARSAAALVALYTSGVHDGEVIERGRAYLQRFQPDPRNPRQHEFGEYGHYYAVQAAWHAGDDFWKAWYPAIREELLGRQDPDGSWSDENSWIGIEYSTAMALIVLQAPNHLLPIFDR